MPLACRALGRACALCAAIAVVSVHANARAEGSTPGIGPLADTQALRAITDVSVDILDFNVETLRWTGRGTVQVFDPNNVAVGSFASGATITPTMNGVYRLDVQQDQFQLDAMGNIIPGTSVPWDVTVFVSGVARPGRVFSFMWAFNAGNFSQSASTNASFYAKVPGGDDESFSVMELRTDGLAGFIFEIQGNSTGVRGVDAGRSVPEMFNGAANEYAMYLNPPDNASYSFLAPTVSGFGFQGGLETSGGVPTCDEFVAGTSRGAFTFTTNVQGSYHIICDVNGDGMFDIVDDGDLLILGAAVPGVNSVVFDGLDNNGNPLSLGSYQCRVRVTVGEFHYVGRDIETSYLGLRMFQVDRNGMLAPLNMFWNDALVQAKETTPMPSGCMSESRSPPNGFNSGNPADAPVPLCLGGLPANANARGWGDFVLSSLDGISKGDTSYLDTYTWLDEALSTTITIRSVDGTLDTDGEGLTDYVERCTTGTDFMDPDSDADTVNDFVETRMGMTGVDTDADMMINALDTNDDGDCVLTIDEDPDGNDDPTSDDTDGDTSPNYLDADDDGDGLATCMEDQNADGDPTNDDADGDTIPNYLEDDSDDDCTLRAMIPTLRCNDGVDDCPFEQESANGYMDDDGCPEPDRDGDGVPDGIDNCVDIPNTDQADLDDDTIGDVCDPDIDDDGLLNGCETSGPCPLDCLALCMDGIPDCNGCGDTDPRNPDTDAGGLPDGDEVARGSDPLEPADDPLPGDITGGSVFACSATHRGAPGVLWLFLAVAWIAWRRKRR